MKKNKLIGIFIFASLFSLAQPAYRMGDITMNFNYGAPQITPAIIRGGINLYYKSRWASEDFAFTIKNSGVLNAKLDYAVHEDLSLGFAGSYWNMAVNLDHQFGQASDGSPLKDYYKFNMSATAIGIRGNYHFSTEKEMEIWDPYYGITLGFTKYDFDVSFNSDDPTRTLPVNTFKWRSGYLTYVSTTFGLRVYPVNFVALNFEAGWDRGAFLFAGIVFKIHTKPPKFLTEK